MISAKTIRAGVLASVGGWACSATPALAQTPAPSSAPLAEIIQRVGPPQYVMQAPPATGVADPATPAAPPGGAAPADSGGAASGVPTPGGGPGPGGGSSQQSVGTGLGGAAPPQGTPDEKKFHGHRYPILPLAPPGEAPIPPTGAGYYTFLNAYHHELQEKPPRWPYPRGGPFPNSFFEVDFTYLDSIPMEERDWAERLKRIQVGDHWLFSTGGEVRYRYDYEKNTRLSGVKDTYHLFRNRTYGDLWYEDIFRLYGEFYYGDTRGQDFTPYARDINRGDIQNLFFDLKVAEIEGNPIYTRIGRQETALRLPAADLAE